MPRVRAAATPALLETPLSTVTMRVGERVGSERDDLGREPVAELEAVRNEEVHRREAPAAQRPHHECAAGGAIGIESPR